MNTSENVNFEVEICWILKEWLKWAQSGAPDHPCFLRSVGLCGTIEAYRGYVLQWSEDRRHAFEAILTDRFGSDWEYPFGGYNRYMSDYCDKTMHLNEERIAFVRNYLEK